VADAPAGIAVLPSTATGLATVAVKVSPDELIFEPTAWPKRTVSIVPAGTTKAFGASGLGADFIFDIFDIAEPESAVRLFGAVDAVLSLEFDAVESAGLRLQPSTVKER